MNQLLERLKKKDTPVQQSVPKKQTSQFQFQQNQEPQLDFFNDQQPTVIQEDEQEQVEQGDSQKENISNLLRNSKKIKKQTKKPPENGEIKKKNKKLLGQREPWTDKCRILQIQPPFLNQEQRSQKKYKIRLKFLDNNNKVRNYTIRFGSKAGADYVDHKNIDKRQQFALRVRNCDSVLNPNYWRVMLLNNEFPTIEEAWDNYVQTHNLFKMLN